MSTREARGVAAAETEEEIVARYLQHNVDFFERHQPLLSRLRLPHVRSGSTISLVERQVEVLREKHAALEEKLAEFVRVARANDAIADRLHRFTRRLLCAGSRDAVLQNIESGLRQDFDSFNSVLLLVGDQPANADQRFLRTIPQDDPRLKSFVDGNRERVGEHPRAGGMIEMGVGQQHLVEDDAFGLDARRDAIEIAARIDDRAVAARAAPHHRAVLLKRRDRHGDTFQWGKHAHDSCKDAASLLTLRMAHQSRCCGL